MSYVNKNLSRLYQLNGYDGFIQGRQFFHVNHTCSYVTGFFTCILEFPHVKNTSPCGGFVGPSFSPLYFCSHSVKRNFLNLYVCSLWRLRFSGVFVYWITNFYHQWTQGTSFTHQKRSCFISPFHKEIWSFLSCQPHSPAKADLDEGGMIGLSFHVVWKLYSCILFLNNFVKLILIRYDLL